MIVFRLVQLRKGGRTGNTRTSLTRFWTRCAFDGLDTCRVQLASFVLIATFR